MCISSGTITGYESKVVDGKIIIVRTKEKVKLKENK